MSEVLVSSEAEVLEINSEPEGERQESLKRLGVAALSSLNRLQGHPTKNLAEGVVTQRLNQGQVAARLELGETILMGASHSSEAES